MPLGTVDSGEKDRSLDKIFDNIQELWGDSGRWGEDLFIYFFYLYAIKEFSEIEKISGNSWKSLQIIQSFTNFDRVFNKIEENSASYKNNLQNLVELSFLRFILAEFDKIS